MRANDDYFIDENNNFDIIYTKNHKKDASFVKDHIQKLMEINDKLFAYKFDEKLTIVLKSNDTQVANAYSTQYPNNMGVYYNGGAHMNNYFAHNSWLATLLTHETIHNYQMNAKKSKISKFLKKYLGSNYMPVQAVAFFFTSPNIFLPTVLVEGNAVLNESLYQNGGRLHSGIFKAMKNSLLINSNYTPTKFINNHTSFPYGVEKYIVGGFFMKFLSIKYGLSKVNKFFYAHSIHSLNPFLLNSTFETHFGKSLEQLIGEFITQTKIDNKNFEKLKTKNLLNSSKTIPALSKIDNKIYFLSSNLKNKQKLNIYDTQNKKLLIKNSSLNTGKIFKIKNKLHTNTANFIDTNRYKVGLFDDDGYIDVKTIGKSIQDIHNNKISYIDISKSFQTTKLYIDHEFYATVASNAMFDKDGAIYYFKQDKNKRVLYKNKKQVYSFDGYFSKIVDIVDDEVYIVANTKDGVSLYSIKDGKNSKLFKADNIIDAKYIDKKSFAVVSIDENGYKISINKINKTEEKPHFQPIIKKPLMVYNLDTKPTSKLDDTSYNEFRYLNFTNIYPIVYLSSDENSSFVDIAASFVDTMATSKLDIKYTNKHKEDIGLVSYINQADTLQYGLSAGYIYRTEDNDTIKLQNKSKKDYIANLFLEYALLKVGRHTIDTKLNRYYDPDYKNKNPAILKLSYDYVRKFALSYAPHRQFATNFYLKADRNNSFISVDVSTTNHLFWHTYLKLKHKNTKSDVVYIEDGRGIKVHSVPAPNNFDETNFEAISLNSSMYAKDVAMSNAELSTNLGFKWYAYSLPISLRNETLFVGQNIFDITINKKLKFFESYIGMSFDILFGHTIAVPVVVRYIKNNIDDKSGTTSVYLGVRF